MTGDTYEGEVVNGKISGEGKIKFGKETKTKNISYEGTLENGRFNGHGILIMYLFIYFIGKMKKDMKVTGLKELEKALAPFTFLILTKILNLILALGKMISQLELEH